MLLLIPFVLYVYCVKFTVGFGNNRPRLGPDNFSKAFFYVYEVTCSESKWTFDKGTCTNKFIHVNYPNLIKNCK